MAVLRDGIKDRIDGWVNDYALSVRPLLDYRPLNAQIDLAYTGRYGIYTYNRQLVVDFRAELEVLRVQAEELANAAALEVDDAARLQLLRRIEPLISTQFTVPAPADAVAMQASLTPKQLAFTDFLQRMDNWLAADHVGIRQQLDGLQSLLDDLPTYTTRSLDLTESNSRLLVLAQDMLRAAAELAGKSTLLFDEADALFAKASGLAAGPAKNNYLRDAVRKLLGEDFLLVPRFLISDPVALELQQAWNDREQLLTHQRTVLNDPFPVDTWLHGLARVREPMGAWERTALFTEDYPGANELTVVPLQLPYRPDDHWLGLEFPEGYDLVGDRLLYTAHYPQPPVGNRFCGLLLDEWTEVIPERTEDTGLTFHFDRPNNEPPQTWLLALPEEFRGAWQWNDLVGCLHEALDLARLRAIEPKHVEDTAYSHLLPATVAAVTARPAILPQLNYAAVNGLNLSTDNNTPA